MSSRTTRPLACPSCALRYPLDERFCSHCGMPLVYAGATEEEEPSAARRRARKIDPRYAGGDLVHVAGARNQAEAELIQGLLLEEGVPSVLRRTRGFDVPDFLASGPRDVLVPESGADAARELLPDVDGRSSSPPHAPPAGGRHLTRLLAAVLGGGLVASLIAWALVKAAG